MRPVRFVKRERYITGERAIEVLYDLIDSGIIADEYVQDLEDIVIVIKRSQELGTLEFGEKKDE